jgi:hypothetical protein
MSEELWDAFASAVIRLSMSDRDRRLEPRPHGSVGRFTFSSPVHIITAHNPAGEESDPEENAARHAQLERELERWTTLASLGSAPDGSMAEPGFAVLEMTQREAIAIGRRFGQVAIYRWTSQALSIVGVEDEQRRDMGWALARI